jgi:PAS domain S-box-containing protein
MTKIKHPRKGALTTSSGVQTSTEALYRFLVESLTEYAIFAVSPDGIVISWNAGAASTFGFSRDEILGTAFELIFTPEDRDVGAPAWELQAAGQFGRIDEERWHVRKDGSRFWAVNTMQPIYDDDGTLAGFTKIVRDRTESYQSSEALRLSEEQLRLLVESVTHYALFSLGSTGTIKLWNRGAEEVFGYTASQIVGQNYSTLYTEDDARDAIPEAQLSNASLTGVSVDERWHIRKDGSRFFASGRITRIAATDGNAAETRGFVVVFTRHHGPEAARRSVAPSSTI